MSFFLFAEMALRAAIVKRAAWWRRRRFRGWSRLTRPRADQVPAGGRLTVGPCADQTPRTCAPRRQPDLAHTHDERRTTVEPYINGSCGPGCGNWREEVSRQSLTELTPHTRRAGQPSGVAFCDGCRFNRFAAELVPSCSQAVEWASEGPRERDDG